MPCTPGRARASSWNVLLPVAVAVLLAAGPAWCQSPAMGSKGNLRVALASIKQVGDLPQLVAAKLLAGAGYSVTFQELTTSSQVVEAALRGEADFSEASATTAMTAIAKGAEMAILFETARLDYVLAAKSSLTSVEQLHGVRIGIFSTVSDTNLVLQLTLQGHPAVKPQLLIGGFSSARVQAMLAGQMDASPVQFADWLQLKAQGGDRFHILQTYVTDFPDIFSKVVFAKTSLINQKRQLVDDYVKANLLAARQLKQGGARAAETAIREQLSKIDAAAVPGIAKAYSDFAVWPTDGGLSTQAQERTYQALSQTGFIPPVKKAFFDRAPLDRVVKDIGRE